MVELEELSSISNWFHCCSIGKTQNSRHNQDKGKHNKKNNVDTVNNIVPRQIQVLGAVLRICVILFQIGWSFNGGRFLDHHYWICLLAAGAALNQVYNP